MSTPGAMTDWTPEKLDTRPEGTVIVMDPPWRVRYPRSWVRISEGWWEIAAGVISAVSSAEVLGLPGSIRVVSVPVDALLTDEAILTAAKAEVAAVWEHKGDTYWNIGDDQYRESQLRITTVGLRAAIAHVTGGAA